MFTMNFNNVLQQWKPMQHKPWQTFWESVTQQHICIRKCESLLYQSIGKFPLDNRSYNISLLWTSNAWHQIFGRDIQSLSSSSHLPHVRNDSHSRTQKKHKIGCPSFSSVCVCEWERESACECVFISYIIGFVGKGRKWIYRRRVRSIVQSIFFIY